MGLVMDIINMKNQQRQNQYIKTEQIEAKKREVAYKKADMGIQMMSGGDKTPLPIRRKGMQLFRNSLEALYPDEDFSNFDNVRIESKEGGTFLKQIEAQAEKVRKGEAHPDSMMPILAAGYEEYEDNKAVDVYADWANERGKQKQGEPVKGAPAYVVGPEGKALKKDPTTPVSWQDRLTKFKGKDGKSYVQKYDYNPKTRKRIEVGEPIEVPAGAEDFLGTLLGVGRRSGMDAINNPQLISQEGAWTEEDAAELKALESQGIK